MYEGNGLSDMVGENICAVCLRRSTLTKRIALFLGISWKVVVRSSGRGME